MKMISKIKVLILIISLCVTTAMVLPASAKPNFTYGIPVTHVVPPSINQMQTSYANVDDKIVLPAQTSFNIVLQSSISSSSLNGTDSIVGILNQDLVYDTQLIAPRGSVVYGKAVDIKKPQGFAKNAEFSVCFDEIMTPEGESLYINTNKVTFKMDGQKKRILQVLGATAIGAATRSIDRTGSFNDILFDTGLTVLVDGPFNVAAEDGQNIEIPSAYSINVRLLQPLVVSKDL